ncbi:hypothetical protein Tco_1407488 [Tanacetum coccineum]
MGYNIEEASAAMDRCGPEASIVELIVFMCAAQMAKTDDVFFEEEKLDDKLGIVSVYTTCVYLFSPDIQADPS